jgi:gamma-butyrobetaine dioxygenase
MTTTFEIELGRSALGLRWPDGNRRDYPYIWLRDSDPAAFHPDTKERTGDLLSIPENPVATAARLSDGGLQIDWQDGAVSRFDLDWLEGHGPGRPTFDPADLPHETWRADFDVPRHDADAIARNEAALRDWIRDTVVCG